MLQCTSFDWYTVWYVHHCRLIMQAYFGVNFRHEGMQWLRPDNTVSLLIAFCFTHRAILDLIRFKANKVNIHRSLPWIPSIV